MTATEARDVALAAASRGFVQPEVEKRYLQFMQDNHGELDIPRLCQTMWNAGGRQAVFTMTAFSGIQNDISRIESRIVGLRALLESMRPEDEG